MGLGSDSTLHGTYESRSCPFPLGRPVSRKAGKTKQNVTSRGVDLMAQSHLFYLRKFGHLVNICSPTTRRVYVVNSHHPKRSPRADILNYESDSLNKRF